LQVAHEGTFLDFATEHLERRDVIVELAHLSHVKLVPKRQSHDLLPDSDQESRLAIISIISRRMTRYVHIMNKRIVKMMPLLGNVFCGDEE